MPKGVYPRKPRQPKQYEASLVAQVAELYAANHTQIEIAAILGTTQKVVWRVMAHHGLRTRPQIKRDQWGERNSVWKGPNAHYAALHLRVGTLRGKPRKCEVCGTDSPSKKYEWASISGKWDDPSDYKRMCCSCHHKFDNTVRNLGAYARPKGVRPRADEK